MQDQPVIDGRDRDEIVAYLKEIAPYYVDDWDPDREDAGTVMLEIFSNMASDVVERLDRVPEKHQAAFFNSLDFDVHPPEPSKVPVTFRVDETATDNVRVEPGTTVTASATDERPEQRFETAGDRAFEATPATLTDIYATDPGTDRILDHTPLADGERAMELFTGPNQQAHEFYMGHSDLLHLNPGSAIELEITTNATLEALRDYLEWEYYGENEAGEEGWHPLTVVDRLDRSVAPLSEFQQVESFLERQEVYLEANDYELHTDHPESDLLIRSVVDETRDGDFRAAGREGTDPAECDLPENLFESRDVEAPVVDRLLGPLGSLQRTLESMGARTGFSGGIEPVTLTLEVPGETAETEVDGVESRWIRCRIPDEELATPLFDILVDSVQVSIGSRRTSASSELTPDDAVFDGVTLDVEADGTFQPLGRNPAAAATFALACEEAFTKPGATVEVAFDAADPDDPNEDASPELIWEYWNGRGWRRLSVTDTTDQLREPGTVTFEVPADIESTTLVGQESHWVRTRLVDGNYGELAMEQVDDDSWEQTTDHITPPEYDEIRIEYSQSDVPFDHLLTYNNLTYETITSATAEFRPFESLYGDTQTLYVGFDRPLRGGPIHLYLPMEGTMYPHTFDPRINVEYCRDPADDEWVRLDLRDGTADLTERGMLELSFPEETTSCTLFGRDRHWVRVRVTGDEFTRSEAGLVEKREGATSTTRPNALSTQSIVEREESERTRTPPVVKGVYANTEWARNTTTVDEETLGSSSETATQSFDFANAPVLEATVWVDELDSLSKRERARLENDESTNVRAEEDDEGDLSAFWVEWTEVSDFLDSGASSRHYVLDRSSGTVEFGNGKQGSIPPEGDNNIVAEYRTGGGADGDVEPGAVDGLEDEMGFIEEVTNPGPGENGEERESLPEFVQRAPKQLRDRGKPVTRDGFERIARSSAREVAKVECKAGKAETGKIGHVTLLVVPNTAQRKPVPSEKLLTRVEETMREKAPEAVAGDQSRLTVRGPSYVEVSVDATVETDGSQTLTVVQEDAESALQAFVHPLTGGPDSEGWAIGSLPKPEAFTTCLERVEEVQRVVEVAVTYREGESEVTLAGGEGSPTASPDVLVFSGRHDVTVEISGDR